MKFILLLLSIGFSCFSSAQVLRGTISDQKGNRVPYARVAFSNSSYGTVSNGEGKYLLELQKGQNILSISAFGYEQIIDTLYSTEEEQVKNYILKTEVLEFEETVVATDSRKRIAMDFMRKVVDEKKKWEDQLSAYDNKMYVFSSLEKEVKDSVFKDSVISREKLNINEFLSHAYYKDNNIYKDSILAYLDLEDKHQFFGASISVDIDYNRSLAPSYMEANNPYLFVKNSSDADINLFKNNQTIPGLSTKLLLSPISSNAFLYYTFNLHEVYKDDQGEKVFVIDVLPRFKEEAVWRGKLYFNFERRELLAVDLFLEKSTLNYFNTFHFIADYEKKAGAIVPVRKEFSYALNEGKTVYHGFIRVKHSDYNFGKVDVPNKFWLNSVVYAPKAEEQDSSYWLSIRPIPLKTEALNFIAEQDSIKQYHQSEEYIAQRDSIYNNLTVLSFLFNGVGFRNTFKKRSFYFAPLINQVVPFGVGGYRHKFDVNYTQGFDNGKKFSVHPTIDYGFTNNDVKWDFDGYYQYNPMNFAKIKLEIGDVYDFMSAYQSIQGTLAPANRVNNKKFKISHFHEVRNGLYMRFGLEYSDRQNINNIEYPEWASVFGGYQQASDFEGYKIFMSELYLEYHFQQRYKIRNNQKIVLGSKWPVVGMKYKTGIPNILGGQSNFGYLEFTLKDEIDFKTIGHTDINAVAGSFMYKKDLRAVEYKFFRASDRLFFSNPLYSQQNLDTILSTANSYLQLNYIHHFNGFFLNKVWLINKLKLEETIGGSYLAIPGSKFQQIEFYAGLERQLRIKKTIFKLGFYAVSSKSSYGPPQLTYKVGINFFNAFYNKWDY